MNSPIAWPGGKRALAATLLKLIPDHKLYVEVFAGSAKLLFAKQPSDFEVINDLNGNVTNFFRVVKHRAAELAELLQIECVHAGRFRELRKTAAPPCELERALRFGYLTWYSFGTKGEHYASTNAKHPQRRKPLSQVRDMLQRTADRLDRVQIEQRDFTQILERYDSPETFFYLDPPYVSFGSIGQYEPLSAEQRADLFVRLAKLRGRFLLSFDDHAEVRRLTRAHDFQLKPVRVQYTISKIKTAPPSREVLVSNFPIAA